MNNSIGIELPWFMERVEFKTEGNSRELHINFIKRHKFGQLDRIFRGVQYKTLISSNRVFEFECKTTP